LTSTDPPGQDIINSEGQYLQIFAVKPMQENAALDPKKPLFVSKYESSKNLNTFVYSKPVKKGKNEFADLWIINICYEVKDAFPSIYRRSLISKTKEIEITPVENAVNSIKSKSSELSEGITRYENSPKYESTFTMLLKGIIDAAVNGGVTKYKEAFFTQEYLNSNPQNSKYVDELKDALNQQQKIVGSGLQLHAKRVPEELMGLQKQLEEQFQKNFIEV